MEYRSAAAFDCSTWVATREQVEAELARVRAWQPRLLEFSSVPLAQDTTCLAPHSSLGLNNYVW